MQYSEQASNTTVAKLPLWYAEGYEITLFVEVPVTRATIKLDLNFLFGFRRN